MVIRDVAERRSTKRVIHAGWHGFRPNVFVLGHGCQYSRAQLLADDLLHDDEQVVYLDVGYQGYAKKPEMAGMTTELRVWRCDLANAGMYRKLQMENSRI